MYTHVYVCVLNSVPFIVYLSSMCVDLCDHQSQVMGQLHHHDLTSLTATAASLPPPPP